MSVEAFCRAYAPERIGRPWGYRDKAYASGRHRGLDVRLVHSSGNYSIETDVIAISDGVVDYVGRPSDALGPTIRIRRSGGGYEFHSHTIADVSVGTPTTAGTRLGRNARPNERPGQIVGVHDHIVFSDHADGAWNTARPTHDPYPIIQARLAALAAGSPEEEDMPLSDDDVRKISNAVWGHQGGPLAPLIINRNTGRGEYPADTLGYMQVRIRDEVVKPAIAEATKAIVSEVNKGGAKIDSEAVQRAVADAVSKALSATPLSPAEIAKAVNDDHARRMSS